MRYKERVLLEFVAPALANQNLRQLCEGFYASKQEFEVWLTLLCSEQNAAQLRAIAEPLGANWPQMQRQESDNDDLLRLEAQAYRALLTRATRYAVDLHIRQSLVEEQQSLICVACGDRDVLEALHYHLWARSPQYRADTDAERAAFWAHFNEPGPFGLSPVGHWIWNIVLGIDMLPWPEPRHVAEFLEIPEPQCNDDVA